MVQTASHTIYALASGAGRAGLSVFRVSGPQASSVARQITKRPCPRQRDFVFRRFFHPGGDIIDEGLLLWMPAPGSFTGENVAEFHTHGSTAVQDAMAQAFEAAGARQALPGEFTRRAFDNGRMDLTEAEGLADLIDAETQGQRRQALRQMQGGLRAEYENWRGHLIDALAAIEGEIDFPDEGDVPDGLSHAAYGPLSDALSAMEKALRDGERGEHVRAGLDIAIIGPPNAGKSTLLNALARREAAIVSDIAGTTRDIVDVHMVIAGLPVRLSDTAGLRDTKDAIEAEGVKRARQRSRESDIKIGVIDSRLINNKAQKSNSEWLKDFGAHDFVLMNKADKGPDKANLPEIAAPIFHISAKSGRGLEAFQTALEKSVAQRFAVSQTAGLTRLRHIDCVKRAAAALQRALTHLNLAPELAGDDVRAALHAIKELAGETDIEAVLDQIFTRFCIGK